MRSGHLPIAGMGVALGLVVAVVFTPENEKTQAAVANLAASGPASWEAATRTAEALRAPGDEELAALDNDGAIVNLPLARDDSLIAGGEARTEVLEVQQGDTLVALLVSAGVDPVEAHEAVTALKGVFDPRSLRAGQELRVEIVVGEADGTEAGKAITAPLLKPTVAAFKGFSLKPSTDRTVTVGRDAGGAFFADEALRDLRRSLDFAAAEVDSSFYLAGQEAGLPDRITMNTIRAFQYDVDFQRDIKTGDRFKVLYERLLDPDSGELVRTGDILFARMTVRGKHLHIYRFTPAGGKPGYYDETGKDVRKALLRTPVDAVRISSRYGMRKHPILGYNKMHRGVDFAAPKGTPIYAAGSGRIEKAGWLGSYGRYIRIKHDGKHATAYAHLSRIASGIKPGRQVRQGQVIGYVGSSGRSTGPHLHYEVLIGGRQVNPLKVRFPSGKRLEGAELAAFEKEKARLDGIVKGRTGTRVALDERGDTGRVE